MAGLWKRGDRMRAHEMRLWFWTLQSEVIYRETTSRLDTSLTEVLLAALTPTRAVDAPRFFWLTGWLVAFSTLTFHWRKGRVWGRKRNDLAVRSSHIDGESSSRL